ncbi:MAG: isochorismatase [Phycisphaerae bacterium]
MKTGLIIVDVQKDYFPGGRMELVGMEQAAAKARELLTVFRDHDWPTFHIQHVFTQPDAPFFLPGSEGVEIHESVAPRAEDVQVVKHHPNSFRDSALQEELRKAGVGRLVICGAMSHMCIDATTRAAADLGFQCTLIHDACATRDVEFAGQTIPADQVHGSFMSALGWAYAKLLSGEEFARGMR